MEWAKREIPEANEITPYRFQPYIFAHKDIEDVGERELFYFSPDDIKKLSMLLDARHKFVLYAVYEGLMGADYGSIVKLQWSNINVEARTVTIHDGLCTPVSSACLEAIRDCYETTTFAYEAGTTSTVLSRTVSYQESAHILKRRAGDSYSSDAKTKTYIRHMLLDTRKLTGLASLSLANISISGAVTDIVQMSGRSSTERYLREFLGNDQAKEILDRYGFDISTQGRFRKVRERYVELLKKYEAKISSAWQETDKEL